MATTSLLFHASKRCVRSSVLQSMRSRLFAYPAPLASRSAPGVFVASLHSTPKQQQATVQRIVQKFSREKRGSTSSQPTTEHLEGLEWRQVEPGRFERGIDDMERFYNLQESITAHHQVHNWMMSNAIKIHAPDRKNLVEDVKRAWIALRFKHPWLSSQVDGDKWVYQVPDGPMLNKWLEETFFVHRNSKTSRQLFPDLPTRPLKRAVLHYLVDTQEVVLQSPHAHMDGLGIVIWYDNFLRELANPTHPVIFGTEHHNLLPPLTKITNMPAYTPAEKAQWDANADSWFQDMPTVKLDAMPSLRPGRSTFQWLRFSAEDTQKILRAAKQNGVTVTAVNQAAVSHAARIHSFNNPDHHGNSVATIALYDARERIDAAEFDPSDVIAAHTVALPIKIPLGTTLLETARNARRLMMQGKTDDYALKMSPYYTKEFPRRLVAGAKAAVQTGAARPLPSNAHFTSMGSLDKLLSQKYEGPAGTVELKDLWLALDIMTPDVLTAVWTFNGQLVMQTDYNQAYFRDESIARYLRLVAEQLSEGLGITLQPELLVPGQEAPVVEGSAPVKMSTRGNYHTVERTHEMLMDGEPSQPLEELMAMEKQRLAFGASRS